MYYSHNCIQLQKTKQLTIALPRIITLLTTFHLHVLFAKLNSFIRQIVWDLIYVFVTLRNVFSLNTTISKNYSLSNQENRNVMYMIHEQVLPYQYNLMNVITNLSKNLNHLLRLHQKYVLVMNLNHLSQLILRFIARLSFAKTAMTSKSRFYFGTTH